ncbi:MAG: hypothetical protein IPM29_26785 [Planctomycetes bacterium]|nr:hypothetical protein [Planctomycetota bacterium]
MSVSQASRLLALAMLAATASAQTPFSSPRGFLATEGDSSHVVLFNSAYQRFMQIDDTWRGQAITGIRALAFRRDGVEPGGSARSFELVVRFGLASWANRSGTFDANWSGTPTTVFANRVVNLPDWSSLPASVPAPFDFTVPFDVPFDYDGSDAFAFEVTAHNVAAGDEAVVDRELGRDNAYAYTRGTTTMPGCIVTGRTIAMGHTLELRNFGPQHPTLGMQIETGVTRGPASQPCILNVALSPAGVTVPGLCTTVHAQPVVSLPLGSTNGLGDVSSSTFDVPYARAFEGLQLVTQALALDPGAAVALPIALSNDRIATMPAALRASPRTAYLYGILGTTPTATLWDGRAVIARLEY